MAKTAVVSQLIGQDGNVFNLAAIVVRDLKSAGYKKEATEVLERLSHCGSYDEALGLFTEYVDVV